MKTKLMVYCLMLLAVSAVIALEACRSDQRAKTGEDDRRSDMITEAEPSAFDISQFRDVEPAGLADLIRDGTEGWTKRPTDQVDIATDRIEVRSGDGFVSLERAVDWLADEIDAVSFGLDHLSKSGRPFTLYWARADEVFAEERRVHPTQRSGDTADAFLAGHALWKGRIVRIRIDIPTPSAGATVLDSITPMVFRYDTKALEEATGSFWKVELADDLRTAGIATDQHDLVWELEAPRVGELRFSWGIVGTEGRSVGVSVDIQTSQGMRNRIIDTLPQDSVSEHPSDGPIVGWHEVRVPIDESTPATAIRFAVQRDAPESRRASVVAIANPSVVPKRRDSGELNVVLISLDTLRADRLASYGHTRVTSPNLDARAKTSGIVFKNTVAASPRTLPSHTTMLSGLDCVTHGVNHLTPAPTGLETLAEILRERGYRTTAVVGGGLLNPEFGLAQGFDEYYHYSGWAGGFGELSSEIHQAMEKLSRVSDQNFFLFFHTYEIHDPFHERPPFTDHCYERFAGASDHETIYGALARPRSEEDAFLLYYDLVKWNRLESISAAVPVSRSELDLVRCLYDGSITYTDSVVEGLFAELERRELLETTLIIVTSDHGESLGEKGLYKHANLYENNLMVPLIVFLPAGRHGGTVIERQVSSVDIMPTILEVLGGEIPDNLDGASLVPLIESGDRFGHRLEAWSYAAYENRGLSLRINDETKFIFNNTAPSRAFGNEELYDLREDHEELDNLISEDPELADRLRKRVDSYYASKTVGTALTLTNISCGSVEGVLVGMNLTNRLKALDIDGCELRRESDSQVAVALGNTSRIQLFLEVSEQVDVTLHATNCGEAGEIPVFHRRISLKGADRPSVVGLSGVDWIALDSVEAGGHEDFSVELRTGHWAGENQGTAESVEDESVLEQLRALGYLE